MSRYEHNTFRNVEYKKIRGTTVYPEVPASEEDYYVMSSSGDRFDILAKEFYQDQSYWWAIAAANPHIRRDSLAIQPGYQLRIPPLFTILGLFENENNTR